MLVIVLAVYVHLENQFGILYHKHQEYRGILLDN